jgi:hypothetical protein
MDNQLKIEHCRRKRWWKSSPVPDSRYDNAENGLDISAGLPLNGDGTVNFFEYMAWMVKELNGDGNESD